MDSLTYQHGVRGCTNTVAYASKESLCAPLILAADSPAKTVCFGPVSFAPMASTRDQVSVLSCPTDNVSKPPVVETPNVLRKHLPVHTTHSIKSTSVVLYASCFEQRGIIVVGWGRRKVDSLPPSISRHWLAEGSSGPSSATNYANR